MLLRGLVVPDRQHALRSLRRIGYYRLSAFSYPFRDFCPVHGGEDEVVRCDKFRTGTHFDQVIDYVDNSEMSTLVKTTTKATLEQARDNPELLKGVLDTLRGQLGLE